MRGLTRIAGLALVPAIALVVAVPATAQAKPVVHEHYAGTESGTFEECGLTINFEDTFSGLFIVREIKGSGGQAFLGQDNYEFRSVLTNADNGQWMVFRGNLMFKEMSGTHVVGDIWEFTAKEVGQPLVVEDSTGRVVLRDRGRITYRALFDTLGDGEPGGVQLGEAEITGVHGAHPSLDTDFCTVVTELIG